MSWIGDALTLQARRLAAPTAPGRDLTWFTGPELDAHRAAAMLTAPAARDKLGGLVIVALGTFTPLNSVAMDELLRAIGPDRHLILVTPGVRDHTFAWADTAAQIYRSVAASRANTTVVEWQTVVDRDPALLADNGVTLAENATAAKAWTDLINRQIDAAYQPPTAPVPATPVGEPTP